MRDDFSEEVKRIISYRAGLICSNPDCGSSTTGPQVESAKAVNIGVAAHITAASPGGPRYEASLTNEQRRSVENAIWLCQNCAKEVDNDQSAYPTELLRAWKTIQEHNTASSLGKTRQRPPETESQRKLREIVKWKGKQVMLVKMASPQQVPMMGVRPWASSNVTLLECTEHYIKVRGSGWDNSRSIPMRNVEIGHDDRSDCMELMEYDR
jgi:hypothetical protein